MTAAMMSDLKRWASPGALTTRGDPSRFRPGEAPDRAEDPGGPVGGEPESHDIREHEGRATSEKRKAQETPTGDPTVASLAEIVRALRGIAGHLVDETRGPPPVVAGDRTKDRRLLLHPAEGTARGGGRPVRRSETTA